MNDGCLEPIDLIIPERSLLKPQHPAAWSPAMWRPAKWSTDALTAPRAARCRPRHDEQFTFGNATHQYYETICGGSGAGPGFNGTSAVIPT